MYNVNGNKCIIIIIIIIITNVNSIQVKKICFVYAGGKAQQSHQSSWTCPLCSPTPWSSVKSKIWLLGPNCAALVKTASFLKVFSAPVELGDHKFMPIILKSEPAFPTMQIFHWAFIRYRPFNGYVRMFVDVMGHERTANKRWPDDATSADWPRPFHVTWH